MTDTGPFLEAVLSKFLAFRNAVPRDPAGYRAGNRINGVRLEVEQKRRSLYYPP